jgi:Leucine-rich repeat (LRR) protein
VVSLPRFPYNFPFGQLTSLQIANNRIREIEGHIFRALPNLKVLNAQKNRLKVIDGAISLCSELQSVLLDSNQLTVLPIEMHLLKRLEILKISDNRVTHLMFGARDLFSLQVLHL